MTVNDTKRAFLVLLLVSWFINGTAEAASGDPEQQVSAVIDALVEADGPGIQYVLVDKDKVLYQRSAGLADIAGRAALTDDTVMAAFSMTKTVTATAVLQLHEAGKLNIDDRAAKYVKHPYHQEMTVRQLLSHTGGVPNPIPLRWVHLAATDGMFQEQAALDQVLREHGTPSHRPGEEYEYSNIGYWLLGKVIEAASGQDYRTYVIEHLFRPLKLRPNEIGFCADVEGRKAKGYLAKYSFLNLFKGFVTARDVWGNYEGSWLAIKDVCLNGPAFGGAFGTARAFSRILQDQLSDRSTLLGRKGKELLFTQERTASGEQIAMTPGWHIGEMHGMRYFFKEGGGAGFHTEMRIYPSAGVASVVMTNRTSFDSRKRLSEVDAVFLRTKR